MNDSGIAVDTQFEPQQVVIDMKRMEDEASKRGSETSSGSDSGFTSKRSETAKRDDKSETPSEETDDSLPAYSSFTVNALESSNNLLLNSTQLEKKKDPPRKSNCLLHAVTLVILTVSGFISKHSQFLIKAAGILFVLGNLAWLIIALVKDWQRALPLLVICCLVIFFKVYSYICEQFGGNIAKCFKPCSNGCEKYSLWVKCFVVIAILAAVGTWIALDTSKKPYQLKSLAGYFAFLFLLFIFSKNPEEVKWRPIIWGCGIQICLGFFILRTKVGFAVFSYVGDLVQEFLKFVDTGCEFVFGPTFKEHFFAFSVLPIIIYFSAFISILYHLGAMQWLISKIAWVMQISLGTSATESMVAAGNIFVGQTESPLLIRPYIKDLTTSELHAVMTAGFGTIAGSVLGAYLGFGIQAIYVITACVMAAPCALAVSKLMYPETRVSKFASREGLVLESSGQRNIIEAAFVGASQAIPLVLNIGANLIAFLALLASVNAFLKWYGSLLDIENLSFGFLCSYLFMPFSFLMGIERADCFKCAELIGMKVFLNEFIAYEELSELLDNRNNNVSKIAENGDIQWITDRSEAIITYALCGFANVGSLGIQLGGLGAMCPERQSEMAKIVIRALIGGIFVSFLNACIAGFLYEPPVLNCDGIFSSFSNTTSTNEFYKCCAMLETNNSTNITTNLDLCCDYTFAQGYGPPISGC